MRIDDIRFLFAFDRWATTKVLDAAVGVDATTWSATDIVDERGLGGILVHQLGATQRWRHGLSESGEKPRPEREPLPTIEGLRAAWEQEWVADDMWLESLDDAWLEQIGDGVPFWAMLAHVVNHGTQHRSEAAALLTAVGHSPGDLDMIYFAEETAAAASPASAATSEVAD
jgi:uncharacterized damage-inducible protein DinB